MPSHPRACDRDAAENLEDVDALASRFAGRRCAAGSGRAWLHDRHRAPRWASTLQPDEDGRAWSRRDDSSSPDRPPSSESAKAAVAGRPRPRRGTTTDSMIGFSISMNKYSQNAVKDQGL